MDNTYWFYLYPSVYISIKNNVLLYDTNSNRHVVVVDKSLLPIFESLLDITNMGVVAIDSQTAQNETLNTIVKDNYGRMVRRNTMPEKPAMLPLEYHINIDYDRKLSESVFDHLLSKDVSKYLLGICLIINIDGNSNNSKYYLGQSWNCNRQDDMILKDAILNQTLNQIEHFPISQIRLITDVVYSNAYSIRLENIIEKIHKINKAIILTLNIKDFCVANVRNDIKYEYTIDSYTDTEHLIQLIEISRFTGGSYRFIIRNVSEYRTALELIEMFRIEDYSVIPLYDEYNTNFIAEISSIEYNDIFERPISIKEIFRNTKINSNFFGTFVIAPNGEIFTDVNASSVGNICSHKVIDCVLRELVSKQSWRFTRDFPTCQNCLFQYLCPPPSSYERLLNIPVNCKAFTS